MKPKGGGWKIQGSCRGDKPGKTSPRGTPPGACRFCRAIQFRWCSPPCVRFLFSSTGGVDGRLYEVYGSRLTPLRKNDLPPLALALVGYQRGLVSVWRGFTDGIDWIRLFSKDGARQLDVRVRGDDWLKGIEPYLRSGAWNPLFAPVAKVGYLFPERAKQLPLIPVNDQELYLRILEDLEIEFPTQYPTSNL